MLDVPSTGSGERRQKWIEDRVASNAAGTSLKSREQARRQALKVEPISKFISLQLRLTVTKLRPDLLDE